MVNIVFLCQRKQLVELQQARMLRGNLSAAEQLSLLSSHDDLPQALEGAYFVQVLKPYTHDFLLT